VLDADVKARLAHWRTTLDAQAA